MISLVYLTAKRALSNRSGVRRSAGDLLYLQVLLFHTNRSSILIQRFGPK
jgi:hypothetical protein